MTARKCEVFIIINIKTKQNKQIKMTNSRVQFICKYDIAMQTIRGRIFYVHRSFVKLKKYNYKNIMS